MKNWIVLLMLLGCLPLFSQEAVMCFDQQKRPVQCGQEFIAFKEDGSQWRCKCNCGLSDPYECVPINSSSSSVPVSGGPTQEELNDYYNRQWTDQLSQQADIDFRKGMEAFNQGNCDKAARHFNMARRMVSMKIYEDAYNAAIACKEKGQVTQKPIEKPTTTVERPAVKPTNGQNNNSTNDRMERRSGTSNTTVSTPADPLKAAIESEQKAMDTQTETWVEYQKRQFKLRIEQPNYWCKKYYAELKAMDSLKVAPLNTFLGKKQSELEVGDVILVGPVDSWASGKQGWLDGKINGNNANLTHTLTCVKIVDGKRIFLDNQAATGPLLISEEEFAKRYSDRSTSVASVRESVWGVAQPLNDKEAKQLWDLARKMVDHNKDNGNSLITDYGLYGDDDMVCSESSWALLNATGRFQIPFDKHIPLISGIAFSPASFYNAQQYFMITPLQIGK